MVDGVASLIHNRTRLAFTTTDGTGLALSILRDI